VKIIVMVRDPIDRAWSHYRMVTSDDGTEAQKIVRGTAWEGKTFEEVVDMELEELKELGLGEIETEIDVVFRRWLEKKVVMGR